ncbi:protein CTLA-2-beta-like isoform X1 [Peromyscus leucopus]|uniref:protein CTLA-2-beta-like isoform X1 n=2 Tax=Peromyscus leucopus TaxID=10041 RepID=UPI0010A18ABF|nr:protein CTLA-2-beta-like isoform X1 [Peromyscus leucopus]XP_028749504.1 protein CTLA-2-beta-like isoform X1 [Peromyscus leucopus]
MRELRQARYTGPGSFGIMLQKHPHNFALVFVTSLVLSYCLRMASAAPPRDPSLDAEWEEWKMNFKKSYSPDEEGHRRAMWEKNKKIVDNHNADYEQGKTSFTMGLNGFSDMTDEEFRTNCLGKSKSPEDLPKSKTLEENSNEAPVMD